MNSPAPGLPAIPPAPQVPSPEPATTDKSRRIPWGWLVLVLLCGAGYWGWLEYQKTREAAQQLARTPTRTAAVTDGTVVTRTIRLTGITAAEKFESLIAPRLRASRSGRNRQAAAGITASRAGSTSVPGYRSSTSSASSSSAASGSGGMTVTSSSAAMGGGSSSTSSAFRAATSRLGSSRATTSSSRSTSSAASSEALGSDGLGSTGGELGAGMGGGGGFNEFSLVLQDMIPAGSIVKPGEVVAGFDREMMLQRVEDYRASVAQQQANIQKLKAELKMYREAHLQVVETAKANVEKARYDVRTTPVLSEIDAEKMRLALDEAEAQYKQIQAEVKYVAMSERAQIRDAEINLRASELELQRAESHVNLLEAKATMNGMVVRSNVFRGTEYAQIEPGDQLYPGQLFMQVVDTSSMIISATLNQVDVEQIRIGSKAMVHFDAYPDLVLPAHVVSIAAVTKTGGFRGDFVKDIPIRLKLDQVDPRVIPDLSVGVDVAIESENAVATVPREAVFEDSPDSKPYVLVREGNAWQRREVEIGLTSFITASIRSGVKPGEIVALEKPGGAPPSNPHKI